MVSSRSLLHNARCSLAAGRAPILLLPHSRRGGAATAVPPRTGRDACPHYRLGWLIGQSSFRLWLALDPYSMMLAALAAERGAIRLFGHSRRGGAATAVPPRTG